MMVPKIKQDGNFAKHRGIHGESNVCSTAQRQEKSYFLDACVGIELNNISVGDGKYVHCCKNVHYYSHVLRKEDSHVLRKDFCGISMTYDGAWLS